MTRGQLLILAADGVYTAFWIRFIMHALVWWRVARRLVSSGLPSPSMTKKACALTVLDILFFGRLLKGNAALWLGEWVFHASLLLVLLRHLRFFLNPVPELIWSLQTPGLVAGYILPVALIYILVIRLLTKHERYASPANMLLLVLVLMIAVLGLLMSLWFKPNLVDVKLFALGLVCFKPVAAPESLLFTLHFGLVLVLIAFLPTHIFTAPLVMMEARKREQALRLVMHEK
jgi:nitrate reductase gamma subunit